MSVGFEQKVRETSLTSVRLSHFYGLSSQYLTIRFLHDYLGVPLPYCMSGETVAEKDMDEGDDI